MIPTLHFLTLVLTTLVALSAAGAFHWMLLKAMFVLMRPATAQRMTTATHLAGATAQLARACALDR